MNDCMQQRPPYPITVIIRVDIQAPLWRKLLLKATLILHNSGTIFDGSKSSKPYYGCDDDDHDHDHDHDGDGGEEELSLSSPNRVININLSSLTFEEKRNHLFNGQKEKKKPLSHYR